MTSRAVCLSGALLLFLLTGCPSYESESAIYVQRVTATPITMTAAVEHDHDDPAKNRITLSEGAAMGLECTEYCAEGPRARAACERVEVRVSPEGIADVREAFMLNGHPGTHVLVGLEAGTATLEITSPCVSNAYQLVVEPR